MITRALLRGCLSAVAAAAMFFASMVAAQDAPLETAAAQRQTVPRERVLDAVIEPVNQSTVSAQTSGRVAEIHFDVDDFVPQDSVLLRLVDTEQRARFAQADAALREAEARMREARDEYQRIASLFERKLVSQADLDRAEAAHDSAEARLAQARAQVTEARQQVDYTVVRAPYSGIVVERHVQLGEAVQPGQPLMTGFSLEQLRAVAAVPQDAVDQVRREGRARILMPAEGLSVAATGLVVFPYADPASHTFKVRAMLPPGTEGFYPGMMVKVAFQVGETSRLLVPQRAVVQRGEVTAVYIVSPQGQISMRRVVAGKRLDDMTEILSGLAEGERVATDPVAAGILLKEAG